MAAKPFKVAFAPVRRYDAESFDPVITDGGFIVSGYANVTEEGIIMNLVLDCKLQSRLDMPLRSATGATFNSTDKTITVAFGG